VPYDAQWMCSSLGTGGASLFGAAAPSQPADTASGLNAEYVLAISYRGRIGIDPLVLRRKLPIIFFVARDNWRLSFSQFKKCYWRLN
jgi:hypothetical protein